ncbi:hypothetical protein CDAR_520341, partial [Caerostris darwini]
IFPSSSSPILQLAPFWCPEGHPIYSKALQTPLPPIPFNSLLPPSILDSIKDLMHLQAVSLLKLLPVSGTRALDSISMALPLIFKWGGIADKGLAFRKRSRGHTCGVKWGVGGVEPGGSILVYFR